MNCYWCEHGGHTERYFHNGEMRYFHERCWGQINGLGYTPSKRRPRPPQRPKEEPLPQQEVAQCTCKVGKMDLSCYYNKPEVLEAYKEYKKTGHRDTSWLP